MQVATAEHSGRRTPAWRLIIVAVLLALGLTAALATAPSGSPIAPPAASAHHNYDIKTGVSCGLVGGSGSIVSEAYIDYSSSLASVRHDHLKITNTTNRGVEVRVLYVAGNEVWVADFTVWLSPGQQSTYTFRHDNWYERNSGGFNGRPYIVVKSTDSSGNDVLHNHWMAWHPPTTRCLTPAP